MSAESPKVPPDYRLRIKDHNCRTANVGAARPQADGGGAMTAAQRWPPAFLCACVGALIMFGFVGLALLLVAHDIARPQ